MFTFFDVEVFKFDWLAVFVGEDGQTTKIHNDRGSLERHLSSLQYLVGYNNYNYDDKIIAGILKDTNIYDLSQKIMTGKNVKLFLNRPITLDVMQEIRLGLSLKEAQANMTQNIHETPIDFNLDRPLTKKELDQVFKYCENDVLTTKELFEKREPYFASKFEMVHTFKLQAKDVKKTRANLSATILKAKPHSNQDRLNLIYDKRLPKNELPKDVLDFYKQIENDYQQTNDFQELEKQKFTYSLAGVEHIYGFGGLHGAKEKYAGEGHFMQIDVSSFYPSLIINNNLIDNLKDYQKIYEERLRLKQTGDSKQSVYKIILNSTYGAMKSKFNKLYHPRMANSVCVNGQLILTHLILLLDNFAELIQTNTDGIIIKYEPVMKETILKLLKLFEERYELTLDVDDIKKIAQRDVNNYCMMYSDGTIAAKGRFANFDGGDFERNSLTIIDEALSKHYMEDINVQQTVINAWKKNELDKFQYIVKAGSTFDSMAQEVLSDTLFDEQTATDFKPLQKVNRVFAGKDKYLGSVYKTKNDNGTVKYNKVPYTSENCLVWNGELNELDKRQIDLNWYIKQIQSYLF
ncbi:DNA polymerase domain-containing protein [Bacillaceae bacterium W0354]